MKVLLSLVTCVFFSVQFMSANTIIVANTDDTGAGSLRDVISISNNQDTIQFDPNILSSGNDTIKLASTIDIDKNLVIIGLYNSSAALYISGDDSFQIFNADLSGVSNSTSRNLTLDSLRLIKGYSSSGGGAIKFKGFHLNVSNCTFSNNTSTYGGAIYSSESYGAVIINSCVFMLNSATNFGGGIYSNREVILINSDFSNNEASSGGAIFSVRKMSIENSTFLSNTAIEYGGAVNLSSNTSTSYYPFLVTNSTFENNSANFGGAIYTYFYNTEVDLNISNSTFDNNHSVWSGGAVSASSRWYKSSVNINDSSIINNTSDDAAAGIYCKSISKKSSVLVNSCLVDNNVAVGIGGGISVATSTSTDTAYLHVTNSDITNNSASRGGGLSCSGSGETSGLSLLMVENSIISNNIATIDGGGIYNFASASNELSSSYSSKATTIINYSTINNNQSYENGGGLFSNSYSAASNAASKSLISVNQSTFVNNTAIDDGGAIGNYSRNNGYLSFNEGVSVDVNNSTIYNNDATNGGAVFSKFSSYSGGSDPGSMAVQFSSSIITLNGSSDIYAADSIVSLGYNIFSEATIAGSIATDQMQVDAVALSLGVLQLNGGSTPTLLPSITSLAINSGSPSDMTDAQNVPVIGIRDVGSAEYINVMDIAECDSFVAPTSNTTYYTSGFYTDTIVVNGVDSLVYINLSINNSSFSILTTTIETACSQYTSPSGNIYDSSGIYTDTIPNAVGCDSIITIELTILAPSIVANVEMTTATTALFSWAAIPEAIFYQVKYRIKGTTAWLTSGTSNTQRNVPNLTAKKYYQYKTRAQCTDGTWSDFSEIELFYTSACDTPTGIASIYLDNTRMRIRWDNNPNEIKAKVRYREAGTSTWFTQNSQEGQNYIYINNLTPNATYQYRVRSNCNGNDWSAYSGNYFHDLLIPRLGQEVIISSTTKIYPNPTRNILNIEFGTQVEEIHMTISNHLGKVIHTNSESYQKGIQIKNIDMSSFANGYYFITIQNSDRMETFKFVKIK
ncbi:MAG: putative outer membrane repeat protein [Maribacter sp.]|jgi:predicted outer membrane repeat protein